jgi:predicted nucleotidyltransferase
LGIVAPARLPASTHVERVGRTVALLERRGYALTPDRVGAVCYGGRLDAGQVLAAVAASLELTVADGLVVTRAAALTAPRIAARAAAHRRDAPAYLAAAARFARLFARLNPYVISISLAGSLASGGFRESDDVDLNLVVEDGRRHLAYAALNAFGLLHALRRRGKPVDDLTRRPLAPRLMTANLILERSQCFPLERQDEDMAFELLQSKPLHGAGFIAAVVDANPRLLEHFPQLAQGAGPLPLGRRPLATLFPRFLDPPARAAGKAAWRYMQWTRRHRPEALARVAYVRATMRPYTLFDD